MFPYGYTRQHVPNYNELSQMSKEITDAIYSVHRTQFVYGAIFEVIYPASGSSADWLYDELDVACSYAPELRDKGRYGFLLPENQIIPVAEEMWAGFTTMADQVLAGRCDSK